jgi:hypothetical protein
MTTGISRNLNAASSKGIGVTYLIRTDDPELLPRIQRAFLSFEIAKLLSTILTNEVNETHLERQFGPQDTGE